MERFLYWIVGIVTSLSLICLAAERSDLNLCHIKIHVFDADVDCLKVCANPRLILVIRGVL